MAIYGLQVDFMNKLLNEYFGGKLPNLESNEIYLGLGFSQEGSRANMEDFDEVFDGRPLGNYQRARIIFGKAIDGYISNANEVVFNTASEDWTVNGKTIDMIGIFDSMDYEVNKPLIVLQLPQAETILKGETCVFGINTIQLSLTDY